jgi:hypothetical protein
MGNRAAAFQSVDEVLGRFGQREGAARRAYRAFVEEGLSRGRRPELTGGGLIRSFGGWEAVEQARRSGERQAYDERILGGGDFVARTLKEAEEAERDRSRLRREGWTPERVLRRAGEAAKVRPSMILGGGKRPALALGRALACKWMIQDLGMKGADAARFLGISQPAATVASRRGAEEERRLGLRLARSGGEGA